MYPVDGEPLRVLVVDDEPMGLLLVSTWLSRTHSVAQATCCDEALAQCDAFDPDVILLDVEMPGVNGIETCRRIKSRDDGYRPVILLTAHKDQAMRNAGLGAGADDFLSKPVDQTELMLRVRSFGKLRFQQRLIARQVADLRRLDMLKADLVDLTAHDLLNALSGIVLLMEGIELAGVACTPKDLGRMLSASQQMQETLRDMLRIKELEDGVLRVEQAKVSVSEVVERAVALAEPGGRARHVNIRAEINPRLAVRGDAILLTRGLYNLLQNAVKFSPKGAEVEIAASVVGDDIELAVLDRGPGIPVEMRESIFGKYATVEAGRGEGEKRMRGHGLGLFFVKLVCQAHGGAVRVDPREGGGTIFRLQVPAHT
jgi:signal transduction histidine kinase